MKADAITLGVEQVSIRRGRRAVISGLSLTLPDAGIVVLGGPNGSGETSLLGAIVGLHRVTSGTIRVCGGDLGTTGGRRLARRSTGYLPQEPSFPGGFTVSAFLEYCCYLEAVALKDSESAVAAAVADADLGELLGRRLRHLSGGQRRRAYVAGAAIARPRVLVLDEPTVGIDAQHRDLLRAQLRRMAGQALVVLSSHSAEDFESLADHIVFLRAGQVAYSGDRAGFLAEGATASTPTAPVSVAERALIALAGSGSG